MKNLTWQNPEQLFVAQVLINKVKSKCCGIKDNIGKLNERLKDATQNNDDKVHIAGGYQVLVSQDVILNEGKTFESFIDSLKDKIRQELQRQKSAS